jgi:hypothetical protein
MRQEGRALQAHTGSETWRELNSIIRPRRGIVYRALVSPVGPKHSHTKALGLCAYSAYSGRRPTLQCMSVLS